MTTLSNQGLTQFERDMSSVPPASEKGIVNDLNLARVALGCIRLMNEILRQRYDEHCDGNPFVTLKKSDGSIVTDAETPAEEAGAAFIRAHFPDDNVEGEEADHGPVDPSKITWGIDPMDGTNSYILGETNAGPTVCAVRGNEVLVAMVNSIHGQTTWYAVGDQPSRQIRQRIECEDKPIRRSNALPVPKPLGMPFKESITLQASPRFKPVDAIFSMELHGRKNIGRVDQTTGSMSVSIARTTIGSSTFVANCAKAPTKLYDLAAAAKIVQNAGGELIDGFGQPVKLIGHQGLLIAGLNKKFNREIAKLIRVTTGLRSPEDD